jgi:cytochrome oxidase Cu insertion factor (SCO1/SenC/PrrC family)
MNASSPLPLARRARASLWPKLLVIAIAGGVAVGTLIALVIPRDSSRPAALVLPASKPAATWPARSRPAPSFRLHDQNGRLVSLRALRGRLVILTFIDPVCSNLCPLEAQILNSGERQLPAAERPAIVSVSVNPEADRPANFRTDARKWHLTSAWRWGLGPRGGLAAVWRRYGIGVRVFTRKIAGVRVRSVAHTEAAYMIDRAGYERALFFYPFTASDVVRMARRLAASS